MSDLFNEEQQKVFDHELAKKKEQWKRQYEGWLSPEDVATQHAELTKQVADLTTALDEKTKENEGFSAKIEENEKTIKGYEARSLKSKIAHEAGLSYDAIDFLKGDDEEAIKKSAETLKKLMGSTLIPPVVNEPKINKDDKREALKSLVKGLNKE